MNLNKIPAHLDRTLVPSRFLPSVLTLLLTVGLSSAICPFSFAQEDADPPEVVAGERLFLETRFAQFYFARAQGNANYQLPAGDGVMNTTVTTGAPFTGPFAGQSMNCRACHLVDEHNATGGNRTYSDFARRSPVPAREDGQTTAPRNSPPLVTAARPSNGHVVLHHDGEFSTGVDLVKATFTGRNFGWLPQERAVAVHHLANVIRNDDGAGALAAEFGNLPYAVLLKGTSPAIPAELRVPAKFRINVASASDEQILTAVARIVDAYDRSLQFAQDAKGQFETSPFDVFLAKNQLPRKPAFIPDRRSSRGYVVETDLAYSRRLRASLNALTAPQYVTGADGEFLTHDQAFQFGPAELAGLKIFLAEPPKLPAPAPAGQVGNCIACHMAPSFSDFSFHNTGAAQEEYDGVHGAGAFARLVIPSLSQRRKGYDAYLPATSRHPSALGVFKDVPALTKPGRTDLGMWNVFANPDMAAPQTRLRQLLFIPFGNNSTAAMLDRAIARFKTPSMRDLAHGAPYLHNGSKDTIESVLQFYRDFAESTRQGGVRNPDENIGKIHLDAADIAPLTSFLRALNEDYN